MASGPSRGVPTDAETIRRLRDLLLRTLVYLPFGPAGRISLGDEVMAELQRAEKEG